MARKTPTELRRHRWYGVHDLRSFGDRSRTALMGFAPEAHGGGPLALVRDGDPIELDMPNRKLTLRVDEATWAERHAVWSRPPPYQRGYGAIFARHVTKANEGCDFDLLARGAAIPDPQIH